ncbi:MAG: PilZ domain-containing protein [Armatimonadetes bacterium]|nr:PilZ domain-containing protein [Armatimonadota bacterium]
MTPSAELVENRYMEKRRYKRHPKQLLVPCVDSQGIPFHLETGNISGGGIGFATIFPVKQEMRVAMVLDLGDRSAPMHVLGKVVWVNLTGERFLGGIEFDLPDDEKARLQDKLEAQVKKRRINMNHISEVKKAVEGGYVNQLDFRNYEEGERFINQVRKIYGRTSETAYKVCEIIDGMHLPSEFD